MNAIAAAIQNPAPKPNRDLAPSAPEANTQKPPESGEHRGFGAVLRDASASPSTASAEAGMEQAAEESGHDRKVESADSRATPTEDPRRPADAASSAAAMLAVIFNAALPALATAGTGVAMQVLGDAAAASAPADPSARTGASSSTDSGSKSGLDATALVGEANGSPRVTRDGLSVGKPPPIEAMSRAVHFKPVSTNVATVPASAPAVPSISASAEGGTGDAKLLRTEIPGPVIATGPKALPQPRLEPALRTADTEAPAAAAGPDRPEPSHLEDIRAISGTARTALSPAAPPGPEGGPVTDRPGEQAGSVSTLPAAALPTIAAAIKEEIERAAAGSRMGMHAEPTLGTASDGPLRVLRIQLRPEDLGIVTVELRLTNGQLETHLRAARPETAALLHRDVAVLTDLLKQANYQAEVTVGQARPADMGGASGGSPSQGQPSFADGGARPGQGGARQRQAEQHPGPAGHEGERMDETVRFRDGGVYL